MGRVLTGRPLGIALMRDKHRPLSFCGCSLSLSLSFIVSVSAGFSTVGLFLCMLDLILGNLC